MNKSAVEPYAWGLGLDTQEYDTNYDGTPVAGANTGLGYGSIIQRKAQQVILRTNNVTTGVSGGFNATNAYVTGVQINGDNSFAVPLFLLAPELLTVDQ